VAVDDHGAKQQAAHDPVIHPQREKRRPDPQETVNLVLAKAVAGHKGCPCINYISVVNFLAIYPVVTARSTVQEKVRWQCPNKG